MAEEQAGGTAAVAGTDAPDIDAIQAEAERKAEPRTVEDFARERGWKPADEYEGPQDEYRDAEQFLAFGMDRNRDLIRDVKQLRDTTERMSRTQAEIIEQSTERARREERARLEAIHRRAVEDGDQERASQAVDRIAELAKPPTPSNGAATDSPGVARFRQDNAWFDADPHARAIAVTESIRLAELGKSEAEQLQGAREVVHKRFPEYAPAKPKPAPAVNGGGTRTADTRRRGKGFADMPAEAQEACRELVKRGLSTQDGYVKHYWNEGEAA